VKSASPIRPRPSNQKPRFYTSWVITRTIRKEIRKLILGWEEPKIGWDAIVAKVQKRYETDCTRQALSNHEDLQQALQTTKDRLRKEASQAPRTGKSTDYTVEALQDRIRYFEGQVEDLENEIKKYEVRFIRWQANAYMHGGMTFDMLDASIDTNRSREVG
jgi:hypothetical protein